MRNELQAAVRYFEMRCEGKTDFEALAMCDRREMERTALSALRDALQRQPDPATGVMPCGCGGQGLFEGAYLDEEVPSSYRVCLSCAECGMSTAEYEYEQEAMRAWNTAMGWKGGAK